MGPLVSSTELPHTHLLCFNASRPLMLCLPLLVAGYFLLSVVSTGAADMMLSDKGNGEHYLGHAWFVR
jgi:hypothetical protein